nr:DNA-3-methyladenine glycosylase [Candidatus Gracilibacteria bacterium]
MKLTSSFFNEKDSVLLAQDLLGKAFTKITPEGIISGIINETEAYREDDEASHSYGGKKTKRNEVMFKEAGYLYVYFTYGMYNCMNIVSEKEGYGGAVLIRSVIPYKGIELMISNREKFKGKKVNNIKKLSNGPAKVCIAYDIDKKDNGINLLDNNSPIFIEDIGYKLPKVNISKRIGISKGVDKTRRFYFGLK